MNNTLKAIGLRPDWILIALPLALRTGFLNIWAPLVFTSVLALIAFFRKPEGAFRVAIGPFLALVFASAVVLIRPAFSELVTLLTLVVVLILVRVMATVDARRIIESTIDGTGLLLIANVVLHAVGFRPEGLPIREPDRIFYPLATSTNSLSLVAAAVILGSLFMLREPGFARRSLRIANIVAGFTVIVGSGTRTSLGVTVLLLAIAATIPYATKWLAPLASTIAAASAFVLPGISRSIQFIVEPLSNLNPGRQGAAAGNVSFQGRTDIWESAIGYWNKNITDIADQALGFGELGQWRSGASLTYLNIVQGLTDKPELSHVHNSFLQQMFDGGLAGFAAFAIATYWAGLRLSRDCKALGRWGLAGVYAFAALLLGSVTEADLSPGMHSEAYWMLLALVAAASQAVTRKSGTTIELAPPWPITSTTSTTSNASQLPRPGGTLAS